MVVLSALSERSSVFLNGSMSDIVAQIVCLIVRSAGLEEQQKYSTQIFNLYFLSRPSTLIEESSRKFVSEQFHPFTNIESTPGMLCIFTASLAAISRQVCGVFLQLVFILISY